jgi:hypothetical protein
MHQQAVSEAKRRRGVYPHLFHTYTRWEEEMALKVGRDLFPLTVPCPKVDCDGGSGIFSLYVGKDNFILAGNCSKCEGSVQYQTSWEAVMLFWQESHRHAMEKTAVGRKALKEEVEKEKREAN